jgi:hypothetical protein
MTKALQTVDVNVVPRVHGARELGVLSLKAQGDARSRVEVVGGEQSRCFVPGEPRAGRV